MQMDRQTQLLSIHFMHIVQRTHKNALSAIVLAYS
jgi:hypothetical protein